MRRSRSKLDLRKEAICHHCKGELQFDLARRSLHWAFGIPSVTWLLCSYECQRLFAEECERARHVAA